MSPSVAFIGHLASLERYRDVLTTLRGADLGPVSPVAVRDSLGPLAPMPLCDFWFRSLTGRELWGRYVELWLLIGAESLVEPAFLRAGLKRVEAACREAHAFGARIAALGGFSSILGEGKLDQLGARDYPVLTTGNSLTAAVLAEQVAAVASAKTRITIVGAAGDVGSGLSRLLFERGYPLVLIGRNPQRLARLSSELGGVETSTWEEAAPRSEVVVLVASTALGSLSLATVPEGAWVLDAGHPPNAADAGRVRYAPAGRVRHAHAPRTDLPAVLADCAAGETHACLAEALVLAYESRFTPFSRGRGQIRPEQATEIRRLALRHGIEPAPLHIAGGT